MLGLFKALADPCRLRLTAVLLAGEFTVQELTGIIRTGQSRISHHLKILAEAGVLTVKQQGTWNYYTVGSLNPLFTSIRPLIEQELEMLPERSSDLAAVAVVLEARRRRSQEFFDRNARQWDDLVRTLLPLPEYFPRLLQLIPSGGTLLEIGIGTGGLLIQMVPLAEKVIGVDHSPAMLDEARRRLAQLGFDGVELRLGEMNHLPLPDRSVSAVVVNMVLHHAANPAAVLSEIMRVIAPGGLLLIADLARHDQEAAREQLADQWLGFETEELEGWMKLAGFTSIRSEIVAGGGTEQKVLIVTASKN